MMSEIAKFLIKNNLINETYTNYLVRQSPNGLREEEKKFLVSVLLKDSEELKKIKVLKQDKIYEIFLKLSNHHFSVDNFFNEAIYDYFNKAFSDNNNFNKINIQRIEDYFKKIIFFQDTNDPQKITLNLNSISRILYNKLVNPQEDHLFTKMKSYVLESQISDNINDDVKLLLLILDKKMNLDFEFNLDFTIEALLERIYHISDKTNKQLLEQKLLDLISKKINNKIPVIIFEPSDFQKVRSERKKFYKTLWEKEKISLNSLTLLAILSIFEDKQIDSYENIYDKLNTHDAKNTIIKLLNYIDSNIFSNFENYSHESDNLYITSNINSFRSIIRTYMNHEDKKIPFNLFNPIILWEELTNVQSEISRKHYKEIFNTLDKDFITEQLNKSSISLLSFKKLLENYKDSFSNKINIEILESDAMKSLVQIPKKRTKRKPDSRINKKNKLIKYINQHSEIDEIDKNFINRYSVDDFLSTKGSINNKELYLDILNMKKSTVRRTSNINKIEKVVTELKSELSDTSWA